MRYLLSLLLSLALVPAAFSQALPVTPTAFPSTSVGNVTTFGPASASAANAASWSFPHAANGPVYAQSSGSLALPGGRSATITPRANLSPAVVGPAIARAAAKILPWVAWGVAIKGLMNDLGFTHDEGGFKKTDPLICTVAPCYQWSVNAYNGTSLFVGTLSEAMAFMNATYPPGIFVKYGETFYERRRASDNQLDGSISRRTTTYTPASNAYVPATQQELADAIASKSGWPSGSKIGDALNEAVEQGETLPIPAPSAIDGPASVPGTSTTTQKVHRDAQGNQTGVTNITTNTVHNFTYSPNTVTITNVTTTTTTNPDGSTETSTDQKPQESEEDSAPSDTPLGSLPVLYERKYPNGLTGVWNEKKAALTSSPLLSLVSGLMPSVGLTGTCPILMVNLDVGFQNFGTHDFAPPCWIWDFGRVVVIVSALLLARALIFGG